MDSPVNGSFEAVDRHVVDHRDRPERGPEPRTLQQVRRITHRLLAAGHERGREPVRMNWSAWITA